MASNSLCARFLASRSPLRARLPWRAGWQAVSENRSARRSGLTHLFPPPEVLADAKLGNIGLTGARAETIRALARAVCSGEINFEGVVDSDAFLNRLCEVPGIGKWTAQYVAMRALGEPDAFPSSDLGLLRAMALGTSRDLEQRAEAWRPWRAYAAMYLWRIGSQCAPQKRTVETTIFAAARIHGSDRGRRNYDCTGLRLWILWMELSCLKLQREFF